jgi:hypothetical protein
MIDVHASGLTLGSTVAVSALAPVDPTRTDIVLTAENGSVLINGVVRSPNGVSVVQRGKGLDRVAGIGRVKTRALSFHATAVGRGDLMPGDPQFFLRTDVDSVTAEVQSGFAIDELNDVSIPYLRSPAGIVAIRAAGYDERPGSVNGPAIAASLLEVGNLYVSAPNGSIDLRNDTSKRIQLGIPAALASGTVESMRAAGSVTIISSAGAFDVYDAPVAGSGARRVDAVTVAGIKGAAYDKGIPGQRAGTITSRANGAIQAQSAFAGVGRVLRVGDRVLVKDGLRVVLGSPRDFSANGVYVVQSLGGVTTPWKLARAADSDTFEELPTNTVVNDADKGSYWRLQHAIPTKTDFGGHPISVQGYVNGYVPVTTITSSLVVPANDIRYVVSSSDGTNTGAGSLGKMIRLRQENHPTDPTQVQSMAFSRLLTQPISLREELPTITVPVTLDANVQARVTPPGTTAPQAAAAIVVSGQLIARTFRGSLLYRGTTSGTVASASLTTVSLSPAFADTAELRVGMAVAGNGIRPGSRVVAITPSAAGTVVVLDTPVDTVFNPVTNKATISVTFSTDVTGLSFSPTASGSKLAALNIGGFESGAAVKVEADTVTLDGVNIGSNGATTPSRLGNQVGLWVLGGGNAAVTGGQITSNSIAGVVTRGNASVSLAGTTVGTQNLPNTVGLDLGGKSAAVGKLPSTLQPIAPDTFVQYNRRGIVVRSGANVIQNTIVGFNSFEGITVEGGANTIGNTTRTRFRTGVNVADSNIIHSNGTWGLLINGSALSQTNVYDNVFGSDPARATTEANKSGNVAIGGTLAGQPFGPNVTTGLDANGNQHGLRGAATPSSVTGSRPWQPRS